MSQTSPSTQWYDPKEPGEFHERVFATTRFLRERDTGRRTRFLRNAKLYSNRVFSSLNPSSYANASELDQHVPKLNIARNMVASVQSKIAKNRPKPTALTECGDFGLGQKARKLDQFAWGLFYRENVYQKAPLAFRDAEVFGTGLLKVWGQQEGKGDDAMGRVRVERVFPWELIIDPVEAYAGDPRSMFREKLIDRRKLAALFPKHDGAIMDADGHRDDDDHGEHIADQILVVEAHRLPSFPGANDGRHVICIENATLQGEGKQGIYRQSRMPYVAIKYTEPLVGFWGDSLTEEVEAVQEEMDSLMDTVQQAMWHNANPKIILANGSQIDKVELNNSAKGCVIHATGEAPQWVTNSSIHPEVIGQIERLYQWGYELSGVSQLSAQSKKPAGLNSGKALVEFNDIESERFQILGQAYENFFCELAYRMFDAARQLDSQGVEVEVTGEVTKRRRNFLKTLKWSEVSIDDDAFVLKVLPASSLPQTPAGRRAAVEGIIQAGLITQREQALALLGRDPDLDQYLDRELAPLEIVIDQMEMMIDEGKPVAPEPFQDLDLAMQIAPNAYMRATIDGAPEERLELVRRYIRGIVGLIEEQAKKAQGAPQPGPQGGQPQAAPPQAAPPAGPVGIEAA